MSKISQGVRTQVQRIAIAQQNMRAWQTILARNEETAGGIDRGQGIRDSARHEVTAFLAGKVNEAWENLSWFAPISEEAFNLLAERTRTWFERDDTEVMSFLGEYGSYHVKDKAAFLAEVRAMFTGVHPDESQVE